MQYRIGINPGDVIYDESRIYGDGINVAVACKASQSREGFAFRRPNHGPPSRLLLASLGQLGRQAECQALMNIAPADYDHYARHRPPWFGLKDFEHMLEGMRQAGWSE